MIQITKNAGMVLTYLKASMMFLTLFFTFSCSQDVLDITPLSDISEENIFKSEQLLEYYVNGRYYAIPYYSFGVQNTDPMSDDVNAPGNGASKAYNRALTNPESGIPANRWAANYAQIRDINFFFSKIEESTIDKKVKTRLTGEMRFLRAFLYADLISLYGDVILITNLPKLDRKNFNQAKAPYQKVVDFVIQELDRAVAELPDKAFDGRASRGAALALKARTLLYAASPLHNEGSYDRGKLQKAAQAAKAVTNLGTYSLEPDYGAIYKTPRYSGEIIFGRTFNAQHIPFNLFGVTSADRYYLPMVYRDVDLNWASPTQSLVDAYEMANGLPIEDTASGYNPQDPYTNRDPRLSKSIIHHGSKLAGLPGVTDQFDNGDGTITIRYHRDANGKSNGNSYTSNLNSSYNILKRAAPGKPLRGIREAYSPWIHFRLAEMYLIIAEAEAELGNVPASINALNVVRKRAGMPALSRLSGTALRKRYRNERRVEFALENMRWYDITRWMTAPRVLTGFSFGVDIVRNAAGKDIFDYRKRVLDANLAWNDKLYYMPIPLSEIQANSLLKQNPGY